MVEFDAILMAAHRIRAYLAAWESTPHGRASDTIHFYAGSPDEQRIELRVSDLRALLELVP